MHATDLIVCLEDPYLDGIKKIFFENEKNEFEKKLNKLVCKYGENF